MTSLWLAAMLIVVMGRNFTGLEELPNKCLHGKFQKKTSGPEELYLQCSPWQNRSCCTYKTTEQIHNGDIYNFNFNHCPDLMSAQCKSRFVQDLCFYECSPNIAPWIVKDTRTWRKERFYNVPLCASDCEAWFNDCAADFTCTDNWSKNFDWSNGSECTDGECFRNSCPKESKCMTFLEIYGNASNFCETVTSFNFLLT
ncbi:hypothetical protein OTU49_017341 [Cherax quadricarinatus]|uniref:Folate receptor-like domain-containing protein n=1 Tax=Cherax quadricarinatus TaxID=27406 RepID=A0AAW0XNX2_CHEQU